MPNEITITRRTDLFGEYVEIATCTLPDKYRVTEDAWRSDYGVRVVFEVEEVVDDAVVGLMNRLNQANVRDVARQKGLL